MTTAPDPDPWIPPIPVWDYAEAAADYAAIAGPEEAAALLQDLLDAPVRLQHRDRTLTVEQLGEHAPAETVAIAWRREHQASHLEFDPHARVHWQVPPAAGAEEDEL
jgi:hypothetical protein